MIRPGRGRKPEILADKIEAIVHDTLHKLRPWHVDTFKLFNDPNFEAKLVDVVGLYPDPPERAVVFSFDDKTQVQALDRTQPSLPMTPGRGRTMTHDYKRNGTLDLFAALHIATGEVHHDTRRRHTGDDVLAFFKLIDLHVPKGLDVHVVLDNLSAHKSEPVQKWLAHPRRKRWHLHFTPTSASWLNMIEVLCPHPQSVAQHQLQLRHRGRRTHRLVDIALERRPPNRSFGPKPSTTSWPRSSEPEPP